MRTGEPSTQMQWRHVHNNVVIANYGGSKQVDNDDGSLFWRVYSNFMAYGATHMRHEGCPHDRNNRLAVRHD